MSAARLLRHMARAVAALWVVAMAAFYFIRFSLVFYHANQAAIANVLNRLAWK